MKVLIIPEDPTLDGFILQPVMERLFIALDRQARIEVLRDPHIRGIDQALNEGIVSTIIEMNPMIDIFCIIVDRDCDRKNNTARAGRLEGRQPGRLVACVAVQEVEVWMLALFSHDTPWQTIRAECDPKEMYADPFLHARGWSAEVGRGRKRAMREISANWNRLIQRCPEIMDLGTAIRAL